MVSFLVHLEQPLRRKKWGYKYPLQNLTVGCIFKATKAGLEAG
jgi:hypothetical protein